MVQLARVKVNWTGFNGAPGYTNLYFNDISFGSITQACADEAVAKVDAWLEVWKVGIPSNVSIVIDPTVEALEENNGSLDEFFDTTPTATRVGTASGSYSAAAGACVNWATTGIRNGRRVRGRTFMVPLGGTSFDTVGSLDNTRLASWRTASNTLQTVGTSSKLCVWSRPSGPEATDGISYGVTSMTINDKVAILTSRRD